MTDNFSPSYHDAPPPEGPPFTPDLTYGKRTMGNGKKIGVWTGGILAALFIIGAVSPKPPATSPTTTAFATAPSSTPPVPTADAAKAAADAAAEKAAAEKAAAEKAAAGKAAAEKAAAEKAAAEKAAAEKAAAGKAAAGKAAAEKATAENAAVVVDVIDGDTVRLDNGEKVRLVGIDSPEAGECNSSAATRKMESLVLRKRVTLAESDEDRDGYGRLLRYVDVGNLDAGLEMIMSGLAIARYDSRDGYGRHPREDSYVAADKATPNRTCAAPPAVAPVPAPKPVPKADSCMAGYSPCLPIVADLDCADVDGPVTVTGADPYRLDRDHDGIGCES